MKTTNGNLVQGMNWIRQEKRLAIYLRDNLACIYCGAAVENGVQLTLDHIRPRSNGGNNEASNLVTACNSCNSARGNRSVSSFCDTVAAYLNHGVTADQIMRNIRNATRRTLPLAQAKAMVNARGSAARVLAEPAEQPTLI